MVYCSDDPIQAKMLEEIGCCAIMPLASLIGSGMGILNPWNLSLIIEQAKVPVLVDGAEFGQTPIRVPDMIKGEHEITVERPGYEPLVSKVYLQNNNNPLVYGTLEQTAGRWHLETDPAGAEVWLDGEKKGVTPLDLKDIPVGDHKVALYLPGTAIVMRKVDTSDGKKAEISAGMDSTGTQIGRAHV